MATKATAKSTPAKKPVKAKAPDRDDLITLDAAGSLLMISVERVRQLSKSGYIDRPKPGRTTVVSAVQGYIRFLKDAERKNTKSGAATRVSEARAAEIELRTAERRRVLIPQEEAIAAMDLVVGKVAETLSGLPARITRDLVLRRRIEAEIHAGQKEIADALAELHGFVEAGGDLPATDTADDA